MSELDPLDTFMRDATAAARDRAAEGVDDGAATRMRIREAMTRPAPRRRFTLIAAVIASMFGGTLAFAAAVKAGWVPSPFHHDEPAPVVAPAPSTPSPAPTAHGGRHDAPSSDVIGATTLEAPPPTTVDANLGIAAADQSAPLEVPAPPMVPRATATASTPTPPAPRPVVIATSPARVDQAPRSDLVRAPRPAITAVVPDPPPAVEAPPTPSTPPPQTVATEAPKTEVAPSAELAAYRHAHELHFRGGDAKAALAAWDDYLRTYPSGALAPDARYDRAILLVKLGRYADARAALAPFANAPAGSYRQREASEILNAISNR